MSRLLFLLTLLGAEAMDIYRSFEWVTAENKDDIKIVKCQVQGAFQATCERDVGPTKGT